MKRYKPTYEYLGMLIQQGMTGWHVLDWDYEHETWRFTARTESEARAFVERMSGG